MQLTTLTRGLAALTAIMGSDTRDTEIYFGDRGLTVMHYNAPGFADVLGFDALTPVQRTRLQAAGWTITRAYLYLDN